MKDLLFLLVFFFLSLKAFPQSVKVDDIKWTDSIKGGGNFNNVYVNRVTTESILIWIKARCDSAGLGRLARDKKLPIAYKWFYKTGLTWNFDRFSYPDDLVNSQTVIDSLHSKLTSQGYIEWNSWSRMPNPSKHIWKVSVVLLDNNSSLVEDRIRIE